MRHAKSSWKTPDISDHDRPLNNRGEKAAPFMGNWMKDNGLTPDYILSSSALRAHTTAKLVAENCDFAEKIDKCEELYLADYEVYIKQIKDLKKDPQTLLLVGHNPTIENFCAHLTKELKMFRTATLAQVELSIENWDQITNKTKGELVGIWDVKDLQTRTPSNA